MARLATWADPVRKAAVKFAKSRFVVVATRQGLLPRAVLFFRDSHAELSPSKLDRCKIEFLTTISKVKKPQVMAINGRIHDNPADPYQIEELQCPFLPRTDRDRFVYELFVRQEYFDFVVLDEAGSVKHARRITPFAPMRAAHEQLARMFDKEEGSSLSMPELLDALRRHKQTLDPSKLKYSG